MKHSFTMGDLRAAVTAGDAKRKRRGGTPDLAEDLAAHLVAGLGGSINDPKGATKAKMDAADTFASKVKAYANEGRSIRWIARRLHSSESTVKRAKRRPSR